MERLAKLLGHAVELRSSVGKGSMFAITVPVGSKEDCVPSESSPETAGVFDLSGALVLVALLVTIEASKISGVG